MGTRGIIGFHVDGKDFLTYNHFDSYPGGKGVEILKELKQIFPVAKTVNIEALQNVIKEITLIEDENQAPSAEDIRKYGEFADTHVGSQGTKNTEVHTWYQLLRKAQGQILPYMNGSIKHMIDSHTFILDSLFCEYAYIVNLETGKLEFYTGFNEESDNNPDNRYTKKHTANSDYFPCKLHCTFDLQQLPSEEDFLELTKEEDDDE